MRIEASDLLRLEHLRSLSSPDGLLSVYLPLDPATSQHHGYVASLMNILRDLRETAPAAAKDRIQEESERVLAFVRDDFVPHGSALVLFSSRSAPIWEVFSFQLPVPALARFGERPYLLPVVALSEDFAPAMVALVNHEEARFYGLRLGELLERERITSDVLGYQRQGGWAAFRFEAERQHDIAQHLQRVVEALQAKDKDEPFQYLVLAGTDESTHALEAILPADLKRKLAGSFAGEMFATDADIVEKAGIVLASKERARETELTQRLIQTALDGGRAALGKDETLQTLREGRARSLVLSASVAFQPLGESAYALAESNGLPVEMVHGEAEALLEPYEGLAAELRF